MAEDTRTTRGRLSTAAWVAVISLALALVVGGPALWIWPGSSARVVSAVFGWVPRAPISAEDVRDLGSQLTGGAVVAFAVVLLERLAEGRFRRAEAARADEREEAEHRRREEEEERNLRLLIGLQKDLTGIDLEGRDLKSYFLRAELLTDATLKKANLAGADLTRCGLVNANLSGTTLTGAALIDARMHGAVLIGAVANAARMQGTLLNDAVLDGADLRGAHLTGADLRRAWLRKPESMEKADLRRAKLFETRIVDANFDGVNLEGAYLEGAYLIGADLSAAINLEKALLANAHYDATVSWPEGFEAEAAGAKPIREDRDALLRRLGEDKTVWYVDVDGIPQTR